MSILFDNIQMITIATFATPLLLFAILGLFASILVLNGLGNGNLSVLSLFIGLEVILLDTSHHGSALASTNQVVDLTVTIHDSSCR